MEAEPNRGELWCRVSKTPRNMRDKLDVLLKKVRAPLHRAGLPTLVHCVWEWQGVGLTACGAPRVAVSTTAQVAVEQAAQEKAAGEARLQKRAEAAGVDVGGGSSRRPQSEDGMDEG